MRIQSLPKCTLAFSILITCDHVHSNLLQCYCSDNNQNNRIDIGEQCSCTELPVGLLEVEPEELEENVHKESSCANVEHHFPVIR